MIRNTFLLLFFILIPVINAQEALQNIGTATKQVSTFTIDAPQLNGTKKIWVYLPKIMPIQKKFSVIYMHDAQNLFDAKHRMLANGT
jgi:alpha-glucosidase